jgi:hypothetical protein
MTEILLSAALLAVCALAPFLGADTRPGPDDRRALWPGHPQADPASSLKPASQPV